MRSSGKKSWIRTLVVTIILFSSTFSFAQTESITKDSATNPLPETKQSPAAANIFKKDDIRGVRFKDGSVVYGTIVQMNANVVTILTKDDKLVRRKFDDVAAFIRADDEVKKEPKEVFSVAVGVERMTGNTTYQIGYPFTPAGGATQYGYFPFSKLEWPLDTWMGRLDVRFNMDDSWRLNGVLKKNFTNPSDNMKDSDWLTASNPSRLDVYSESSISKLDAWIFDIDIEWVFLKQRYWSLYAGLGWQYQKFYFEGNLIHQYSPSGLPGYDFYGDGSVAITYEITYNMPYVKIGGDIHVKDKFVLDGSFAWSPIVKAKDEDHHLLIPKTGTGDMNGNAYMFDLSARYTFTTQWFLKAGFQYTKISVDGDQNQVFDFGVPIGNVKDEADSKQTSYYLMLGYAF
ncbi:MAG TPA: omptin family outer membrane protease [Syntrophales bacterium]|nr:omptin family outer membrane protease [Syntrophales bacterium]